MKKENLKSAGHLVAGLLVIYHALLWFEKDDEYLSTFYFACGIVFIMVASSSKAVKRDFLFNGGIFFLSEAVVLLLAARDLFILSKKYRGYFFVVISVCYLVFSFNSIKRRKRRL